MDVAVHTRALGHSLNGGCGPRRSNEGFLGAFGMTVIIARRRPPLCQRIRVLPMPPYVKNPRFSQSEIEWYKASFAELTRALNLGRAVADILNRLEGVSAEPRGLLENPEHAFSATIERLRHDVNAFLLLSSTGHVVQAAATHASILEVSHTLVHLLGAPSRPGHWVKWRDIKDTPWPVAKVIASSSGMLGWNKERREEEFARFSWASAFKHHNPLTAQLFRRSRGPNAGLAKLTLVNAMDTLLSCIEFYVTTRLTGETAAALLDLVGAASRDCQEQLSALKPTV